MGNLISSIALSEKFSDYKIIPSNGKLKILPKLSKINIFVGANNSGKSRFMRQLADTERLRFTLQHNFDQINELKNVTARSIINIASSLRFTEIDGLVQAANSLQKYEFIDEASNYLEDITNIYNKVYSNRALSYTIDNTTYSDGRAAENLRTNLSSLKEQFDKIIPILPKQFVFKKLYIPTLRGLRSIQGFKDFYKEKTELDYFPDKTGTNKADIFEVFTGLKLYEEIRELLLGDLSQREVIIEFQKFLSESFFENKPVVLIPRSGDVLFVKIGNETELPIHNLGDGIQSIIILTFPLFKSKNQNLLAFIEEPEMFMHPGLQRIFLNTLMKFDNHQFFFTTHSNHFLDLTLDYESISIYTFNKMLEDKGEKVISAKFHVQNVSNESHKTLELLGVKNSSVLLTNCTIWVEGITDRKYLAHYLSMYQEKLKKKSGNGCKLFKEDLHYSFVEYSGSNITHWSFLDNEGAIEVERLCGKLFLIADRDKADDLKKTTRHKRLKEKLGDRFYRLNCREIENLLPPDILKKVIEGYEKEKPVFPAFSHNDYKNELLGNFIDKKILKGKSTRTGKYAAESGTVSKKSAFCEKALSHIKDFDALSPEAKKLTKLIYEFIRTNNTK